MTPKAPPPDLVNGASVAHLGDADPYRGCIVRVGERTLLVEAEPPPRRVSVRAWTDGTTELRIRQPALAHGLALVCFAGAVACVLRLPVLRGAALFFALLFMTFAVSLFKLDERIVITPAALLRRRGARSRTIARLELRRIVVAQGNGRYLALDIGDEIIPIAASFFLNDATLRWIARRMEQAVANGRDER